MRLTPRSPKQELIDLVGTLGGTWHGLTAMCRCPAHSDQTPSLSIRQGDRGIVVTCFAGCDRIDILRELSRVRPGRHFEAPSDQLAARQANIERLWEDGMPARVALGGVYLARRRLDRVPLDLRYHPRCPLGPKPRTLFKPALLVAVREGRTLTALQRIFIDPQTWGYSQKLMLGAPGRGAWRGRAAGPTLAIAEGFETAESFSIVNGWPCWAALGARRLDQLDIPAVVTTLLIAEDNDSEGRRAAARACERYRRPGLEIRRMPPPPAFNDWAELLEDQSRRGGGSGL